MKGAGTALVVAVLVITAAQAAAAVLALLLLIALVYGAFAYPRETFGLLGMLGLVSLMQSQPLACLGLAALIIFARPTMRSRP